MEYKNKWKYALLKQRISTPFIASLIIPFVILDISVEIYHQIAFRLYGLDLVDRSKYIRIDRKNLTYLNKVEKMNCTYCGYINGLLNYVVEIAGITELYWCAIKHTEENDFQAPRHHQNFLAYGDESGFREKYRR